jgi:hypothetical protein
VMRPASTFRDASTQDSWFTHPIFVPPFAICVH